MPAVPQDTLSLRYSPVSDKSLEPGFIESIALKDNDLLFCFIGMAMLLLSFALSGSGGASASLDSTN